MLALVPPYTVTDIIREMSRGLWDQAFDKSHQNALAAMIPFWSTRVTIEDFAALSEYSTISSTRLSARFLAGCDLPMEIERARRTLAWRDVRAQAMAESIP